MNSVPVMIWGCRETTRVCMVVVENSQTPYSATVMIEGVAYGTGYASSKKHAKNEAGTCALHYSS